MDITLHNARQLSADVIEAWAQLVRDEPALNHPLFHPVWARLAAAVSDVEVAVLRRGGEPVGFFPFERKGHRTAWPVVACMTDLHGLVARLGTECDLGELLRSCNLSAWHFDHVPVEQNWFAQHLVRVEDAPVIDLVPNFESYWRQRRAASPSWTSQVQRKLRKLVREVGPLRFVWHSPDDRVFESLVAWKRERIRALHGVDVFRLPWTIPLLRAVVAHQDEEFAGVLAALYAGERLVAVHLGIRNRRLMSSWIPTYDPCYARYSPGAVLHVELARAAAHQGLQQIELGRGLNPLKIALGSSCRRLGIGAVDFRPAWRWCRARRQQIRELVESAPLGGLPRYAYRRLRNWARSFPSVH